MKELQTILEAAGAARHSGKSALLVSVVEVLGSAYRRAGARMLLTSDGWAAGSISGGCLEGDILRKAWWRTQHNTPALVTYDSTADDDIQWGLGLGCDGVVRVLLERLPDDGEPAHFTFARECFSDRQIGVLATVFSVEGTETVGVGMRGMVRADQEFQGELGDAEFTEIVQNDARRVLAEGRSQNKTYTLSGGGKAAVFFEVIEPPTPLVIFGAGHDAVPLVRLAKQMGWHVTVVDHRASWAIPSRFPGADAVVVCAPRAVPNRVPITPRTVAVVMTHQYLCDEELLRTLLPSPVSYVGLLGSRRRAERMVASLKSELAFDLAKLHAPVGLNIGAEGPEEIALSVIAEIQAVIRGHDGGKLGNAQNRANQSVTADVEVSFGGKAEKVLCALSER